MCHILFVWRVGLAHLFRRRAAGVWLFDLCDGDVCCFGRLIFGRGNLGMRWIAILLLLINVGYFGWTYYVGHLKPGVDPEQASKTDETLKVVPTLVLLSEQLSASKSNVRPSKSKPVGDAADAVPKITQPPSKPQAVKTVLVCRQLGPLANEGDAQRVATFLHQQPVSEVFVREQRVSEEKTYWLSLPQTGVSEPLADRVMKVEKIGLSTREVEEGRLAGKIVAGPFISYEVAESYLFRLLAVGVDMAIEPVVEVKYQYWVSVEWMHEQGFVSPSSVLSGFLAPLSEDLGKELQQNACS